MGELVHVCVKLVNLVWRKKLVKKVHMMYSFAGLDMELEEYKPSHVAGNKLQ